MAEGQTNDNNTCVVCFKNVVYYSIGECDHPVCFECSTRMRVLCLQNECPICRQALSRVVFTDTVQPYKDLRTHVFSDRLFERQFKIGFCSEEIKKAYEQLLENRCKLCENIAPFRTFNQLSDHMRKVHERYYCDLCVKHLKIFTSERKCYTRQELAHHRRKGDLDDTSHRGHPLCEFCEERFMDADELYRHLRKEHLYCHLCDADGKNLYYASHSALAHHFRTDHFLCEEGDCAGNHLTAVFRTEIDLKAHKATVHGKGMARGAARQARTIEVQFNITPHSAQFVPRTPRDRQTESPPPPAAAAAPAPARIDTRSDAHFPRLSAAPPAPSLVLGAPAKSYKGVEGLARNERNFPSLGGGAGGSSGGGPAAPQHRPPAPATAAAQVLKASKPGVSIQVHSQPASASSFRLTQTSGHRPAGQIGGGSRRAPLSDEDFPSLGGPNNAFRDEHPSLGASTTQPPKVGTIKSADVGSIRAAAQHTQHTQHKKAPCASSAEAFPALGPASDPHPPQPAQWITVSKEKGRKIIKTEPAPTPAPREPTFNPVADFPTLPVNNSKAKKKPQQQPQPQPQPPPPQPQPEPKQLTKKEKKKQNIAVKRFDDSEPATPTYVNGYDKFTNKQIKEAYNVALTMDENKAPQVDKKIKTYKTVDDTVNEKRKNGGVGNFALAPKDYPPLSAMSANTAPPPVPLAYVQHAKKDKKVNGNSPPAAASGAATLSRAQCGGMTFTNSAGQTFPATPHDYIPPPDFEQRNRALVIKLTDALGSAAAVDEFKVASRAFRDNIISADEFYEHCKRAMGSKLESVFPDLVALLPDISKQQELVVGREIASKLEVCNTCGQLVAPADRLGHDTQHWPPLASH